MLIDARANLEILVGVAEVGAAVAAAWWFLYTTQFRPRLQFDLDCHFVYSGTTAGEVLTELQFIFENKGFVEHRLYDLTVSVHGVQRGERLATAEASQEVDFPIRLFPRKSIVPRKYGYYFVRPGVRQIISHTIKIPNTVSIIRVTASFLYHRDSAYPHTARRIFEVSPRPQRHEEALSNTD